MTQERAELLFQKIKDLLRENNAYLEIGDEYLEIHDGLLSDSQYVKEYEKHRGTAYLDIGSHSVYGCDGCAREVFYVVDFLG